MKLFLYWLRWMRSALAAWSAVAFGGEAHDEVAREHDARHDLPRAVDQFVVPASRVSAVHLAEDRVAAALGGHVDVGADVGECASLEHVVAEIDPEWL